MNYHQDFSFAFAGRIEFGIGLHKRLAEFVTSLGGRKVLIVTDQGLVKAGIIGRLTAVLDAAGLGHVLFDGIEPEPDARSVVAAVDMFRAEGCTAIVAAGGGSPLDIGKAVSVMLTNPGHIRDYEGLGRIEKPGAPLIAVPTTAGTGSESTIWAVISEKDRSAKYGVGSTLMVPDIALCDPTLTVTLPPRVTAVTGIDAMSHALESYVNKATQPISEALSEQAMRLIGGSLRTAVFAGDTVTARADMLLASTMAAMAFNATRLGIVHALAMPLGAKAKIPHADVVSILMPPVMRFNMLGNLEKFARLAGIFGEPAPSGAPVREAAEAGVRAVERLISDVGAPARLSDWGVQESDLPAFAEAGMKTGNIPVNPRTPEADDLVAIMRACL